MNLREEIERYKSSRTPSPEVAAVIRRGNDAVKASGAAGLSIGELAPDFALPNQRGEIVRLSERLSQGPVVLNFYRGVW